MAPLSVLPGRVRFEISRLIGWKEECLLLEESLRAMPGVSEASASSRTGRVLVRFDEDLVSRVAIEEELMRAMKAATDGTAKRKAAPVGRKAALVAASSSSAGHFVIELALHALLPAPLDLLLPAAATVFRR